MPVHDDLGCRMKEFYENIPKTKLMRRCPVIIRIDGKAFHSFTRGFQKPFDNLLVETMQETSKYLCENIQGVTIAYTQSDEISLALIDYKKLESSAWFDYEIQKICSIAASMATMKFNQIFIQKLFNISSIDNTLFETYKTAISKGAMFDARCFNIPKEEVTNYFYWRQLDAIRNSIQMVGQANFSHKELQNKSCNTIKDMLVEQKNIIWDELSTVYKRGTCVIKKDFLNDSKFPYVDTTSKWIIDNNIPIFKGEDRKYIDDLIYIGEI